jgi:hypothetical protein
MATMRWNWGWMTAAAIAATAGCATGSSAKAGWPQAKVDLRLVDDHPSQGIDRRRRVNGPNDERVLLFSGRGLSAHEIAGVVAFPGWRTREVAFRSGSAVYLPNEYTEAHVLLKPQAWGRLAEVRHAFERVAVMDGERAIGLVPVLEIREDQLILGSRQPAQELAWLGAWDRPDARQRHLAYLDWLQQRHRANAQDPEILVLLGEESLRGPARDCARAEALAHGLLDAAAEHEGAGPLLSETVTCYIHWGDHEAAIRSAQRILERAPDLGGVLDLRSRLADSYLIRGETERALEELTAYVEFLKRSGLADKDERMTEALARIDQIHQEQDPGQAPPEHEL